MSVSANLGTELEAYVTGLVQAGRYGSHSEVLREGVRLVQERENQMAAVDAGIERGLADVAAGRVVAGHEVFDRLEAKYAALADFVRQ